MVIYILTSAKLFTQNSGLIRILVLSEKKIVLLPLLRGLNTTALSYVRKASEKRPNCHSRAIRTLEDASSTS